MSKTETQKYREKILTRIHAADLPGYMYEEVEKIVDHLHYYKLKNILKNSDLLLAYLRFLDRENQKQMEKLLAEESEDFDKVINLSYFVSEATTEELGEKRLLNMLNDKSIQPRLQSIMLGIQGLLLLTANEFCHASSTRISLNKMQWERKNKKEKQKNKK